MSAQEDRDKQLEIAEGLQLKLLKRFDDMLEDGSITSTDLATLTKLLTQNGWSLDPTRLPQKLRDKLTSTLDPEDLNDTGRVIPLHGKRAV